MIPQSQWELEKRRFQMVVESIRAKRSELKQTLGLRQKSIKGDQREAWEDLPHQIQSFDDVIELTQHFEVIKSSDYTRNQLERRLDLLGRLESSPYFGRVDFHEDGCEPEEIYIGIASFAQSPGEYLVYDWRAPISELFYNFDLGPAHYRCPAGVIHGELTLKRQYQAQNGELLSAFDTDIRVADSILQAVLAGNASQRMRSIVKTIQSEQNAIIRNDDVQILVVTGPAGSGKTSIALHRVAYLLYQHRSTLSAADILILSPNSVFSDYISDVLPELGEENVPCTSFLSFAGEILDMPISQPSDDLEKILQGKNPELTARLTGVRFKSTQDFSLELARYLQTLRDTYDPPQDVHYQGELIADRQEIRRLYYETYAYLPMARRLSRIQSRLFYLLENIMEEELKTILESLRNDENYLDHNENELLQRAKMIAENRLAPVREGIESWSILNPFQIYNQFLAQQGLEPVGCESIGYEDAPPLILLMHRLGLLPEIKTPRYIVIDEAQDLPPIEHQVLLELFPTSRFTLLGDPCQSIYPDYNTTDLASVHPQAHHVKLNKSYRSTQEIMEFAQAILPPGDRVEVVQRGGEKPLLVQVRPDQAIELIAGDLAQLAKSGQRSMAVICKTAREAQAVYKDLRKCIPIHLVRPDDLRLPTGAVVIPSYLSKGLEFDAVLVYDLGQDRFWREEERNLLYTVCSRALHVLRVYTDSSSPLMAHLPSELYQKAPWN